MKLRLTSVILFIVVMLPLAALACSHNETTPSSFGIYLIDTGELMISQEDIKSYNISTHEFELNNEGTPKWNSFFPSIEAMDGKHFVVKVGSEEIYNGIFPFSFMSAPPSGISIRSFRYPGANNNTLVIDYFCPDPRNDLRIIDFFETRNKSSSFGIYLVETGEHIISDKYIAAYNISSHEIELNEDGIEQWNLFTATHGCNETSGMSVWCLNSKHFTVKIDGEEIYRGSFVSPASSTIPMGEATITYYPWPLDDQFDTIGISFNCFDPRDNPNITDFFEKEGLLK